jgi:hypothetical protein
MRLKHIPITNKGQLRFSLLALLPHYLSSSNIWEIWSAANIPPTPPQQGKYYQNNLGLKLSLFYACLKLYYYSSMHWYIRLTPVCKKQPECLWFSIKQARFSRITGLSIKTTWGTCRMYFIKFNPNPHGL